MKESKKEDAVKHPKPDVERKLSDIEMSIICSNLARGCEKQYLPEQSENFKKLAEFFKSKAKPTEEASIEKLLTLIDKELEEIYPYGYEVAEREHDRGALRALTWSEKVTRMLQSLLVRYEAEGDKMLENTCVYVCSVCGFVYIGDEPPTLCPVCKVPAWKFEKSEGRTNR